MFDNGLIKLKRKSSVSVLYSVLYIIMYIKVKQLNTLINIRMKNFMDENFLLQTETAQKLYHEHAAKMPIIDYHCHLIPQMVADDYQFRSLTEIWLGGDHYKWRAMRTNGVDERFSQVRTLLIGRSLRSGRRPCLTPSVILSTIGLTWS